MRICQVCNEPRYARMYHMEELTRTLFYIILKLLLVINWVEWMKRICQL